MNPAKSMEYARIKGLIRARGIHEERWLLASRAVERKIRCEMPVKPERSRVHQWGRQVDRSLRCRSSSAGRRHGRSKCASSAVLVTSSMLPTACDMPSLQPGLETREEKEGRIGTMQSRRKLVGGSRLTSNSYHVSVHGIIN